jgi:plasmid stability protein
VATLHVRNVPDELYELLRERAGANDRSIGAETIQLLYERLMVRAAPSPGALFRRRAAQQTGALTRFTAEARQAVVKAQAEARALRHGRVATEHLLLGVLGQDVPAAAALRELGLSAEVVRGQLVPGHEEPKGQIPFDPEAKRALELALRESTKLRDTVIAPRHIVLGIAGAEASRGAEILRAAAETATLRRCLAGPRAVGGVARSTVIDTSFRVVALEGDAGDWESQLNEAAALGYELIEIVEGRAIFRRQ